MSTPINTFALMYAYALNMYAQSNEVGGSYHMETTESFLKQQGLMVEVLVTDRHKQMATGESSHLCLACS